MSEVPDLSTPEARIRYFDSLIEKEMHIVDHFLTRAKHERRKIPLAQRMASWLLWTISILKQESWRIVQLSHKALHSSKTEE